MTERPIPEATVGRLPVYLRALVELAESGSPTVSSEALAELTGVNSAKVRKDLSHLGSYGTGGRVRRRLPRASDPPRARADPALADRDRGDREPRARTRELPGFAERGFRPTALVDNDPTKVGEEVAGLRIRPVEDLPAIAGEHEALIGVICTPALSAQAVADAMVRAGSGRS